MFIRRTNTRNSKTGAAYFTHRLVEAVRMGKAVKQRTLLNLGTHFDLPQADWADLAGRIDEVLQGQAALLGVSPVVEAQAQRYAAQIIARQGIEADAGGESAPAAIERFQDVDLNTLHLVRPRSVGSSMPRSRRCASLALTPSWRNSGSTNPTLPPPWAM